MEGLVWFTYITDIIMFAVSQKNAKHYTIVIFIVCYFITAYEESFKMHNCSCGLNGEDITIKDHFLFYSYKKHQAR